MTGPRRKVGSRLRLQVLAAAAAVCLTSCANAPQRDATDPVATVDAFRHKSPAVRALLERTSSYAVFPLVGAAQAEGVRARDPGVLFREGQRVGACDLVRSEPTPRPGRTLYRQIVFFRDAHILDAPGAWPMVLPSRALDLEVDPAIAIAIVEAAGTVVFTTDRGGLVYEEPLPAQRIELRPSD